jgi:methionine biosynthesis protein MetW
VSTPTPQETLRADLGIIAHHVARGSRVLDVGCGDGALMAALRDERAVDARGLEIDPGNVAAAVGRGLSVIQGDADVDLQGYPDASFDYAILSQTLQTARAPDLVLDHLLRIGRRAFVSFPNFAHWRVRLSLLWGGRMPVTRQLPESWYDTPNIHHVTIDDLRAPGSCRATSRRRRRLPTCSPSTPYSCCGANRGHDPGAPPVTQVICFNSLHVLDSNQ